MAGVSNTEYLLAHKTAEEYRRKGYEVTFDAPLDFLPGFRADLLASKADEVRVIEVKSRSSLAVDSRISELARAVDARPGWSFELLLVAEPEQLDSPEGARSFDHERILRRVGEAKTALASGSIRVGARACMVGVRSRDSATGCGAGEVESGQQCTRLFPRSGGLSRVRLP